MLGDDFKDHIGEMVKNSIDDLCNHPDDFVGKIIQSIKDKVSTKLKESHLIPSFVRIAMEKSLGMLDSQKGTLSMPLKAAMMAPPMMAACKAGDNTLVAQGIQKTIDEAFAKICGDSHVEEDPNNKKNNTKNNKNKNKNNSSKNNTAKNTKNNTAANAKTNDPKEVVANNVNGNDPKEVVANNAKNNDPKEVVANNAKNNDPKEVVANNAKTNDPKEDTESKVVEELKAPIEEITPKLKEIIENQEEFKNENNSEDKKKIREEFEQTKKDAITLQEKINEIMTDKGGDLVFTDVINEHYKEYSGYLEKLGLLDTGDEDETEEEKPAEEKPAEEKPAEEKPTEEKPAEEKPAEEKPEEKPEETPAEQPTTEEKPQTGGKKTRTRRSSRKQRRTQRKSTRKA